MVTWRIWYFYSQSKHREKQGERAIAVHLKRVAKEEFQEKQGGRYWLSRQITHQVMCQEPGLTFTVRGSREQIRIKQGSGPRETEVPESSLEQNLENKDRSLGLLIVSSIQKWKLWANQFFNLCPRLNYMSQISRGVQLNNSIPINTFLHIRTCGLIFVSIFHTQRDFTGSRDLAKGYSLA